MSEVEYHKAEIDSILKFDGLSGLSSGLDFLYGTLKSMGRMYTVHINSLNYLGYELADYIIRTYYKGDYTEIKLFSEAYFDELEEMTLESAFKLFLDSGGVADEGIVVRYAGLFDSDEPMEDEMTFTPYYYYIGHLQEALSTILAFAKMKNLLSQDVYETYRVYGFERKLEKLSDRY